MGAVVRTWAATLSVPVASFVCALIVMIGSTQWIPPGPGNVDNLVFPAIAFPLLWVGYVLVLTGSRRRRTAWLIVLGLTIAGALPIARLAI
ncbi:MAG: hypothetical protein AAGF12_02975 [Myxococcota bacterium]